MIRNARCSVPLRSYCLRQSWSWRRPRASRLSRPRNPWIFCVPSNRSLLLLDSTLRLPEAPLTLLTFAESPASRRHRCAVTPLRGEKFMSGHIRLCGSAFRKLFLPGIVLVLILQGTALAGIFGTVRGTVHDAQHRPIENATVVLQAKQADWNKEAATDGEGRFHMDAVPAGLYTNHIVRDGFRDVQSDLTVLSDS